jgi:hypothetical protein
MPRSEGNITAAAQAVAYFGRLSPAELSIAGDGAQGVFALQRRPAAQKVGHATFGDDMGDVVAIDHHRR